MVSGKWKVESVNILVLKCHRDSACHLYTLEFSLVRAIKIAFFLKFKFFFFEFKFKRNYSKTSSKTKKKNTAEKIISLINIVYPTLNNNNNYLSFPTMNNYE